MSELAGIGAQRSGGQDRRTSSNRQQVARCGGGSGCMRQSDHRADSSPRRSGIHCVTVLYKLLQLGGVELSQVSRSFCKEKHQNPSTSSPNPLPKLPGIDKTGVFAGVMVSNGNISSTIQSGLRLNSQPLNFPGLWSLVALIHWPIYLLLYLLSYCSLFYCSLPNVPCRKWWLLLVSCQIPLQEPRDMHLFGAGVLVQI